MTSQDNDRHTYRDRDEGDHDRDQMRNAGD